MSDVDPRTTRHLISDQGEVVIDEVRKHWAAMVGAVLELAGGIVVIAPAAAWPRLWWLFVLVGLGVAGHAVWRILDRRMDRFVITNMRVFRIHGILSQHIATMPLARILDITVDKPFVGRILGYGHFIFESAAQSQGLRVIRFVGDPDRRGLTIQRVIQQAGLRGWAGRDMGFDHGMPRPREQRRGPDVLVPSRTEPARVAPSIPPAPIPWYDTLEFTPLGDEEHARTLPDPDGTDTDPIELPR